MASVELPGAFGVEPASIPSHRSAASYGVAPLLFDGNRVYAKLSVVLPNGSLHPTLAFVDMGSPGLAVSPALARELKVPSNKPVVLGVGSRSISIASPVVDPDLPYPMGNDREVELVPPASVLNPNVVVLDYAGRRLTIVPPEALAAEGTPVPFRLNEKTGLIVVDATINGVAYAITVDSGSAYTWIRKSVAEEWLKQHPAWERGRGAVGTSNMRMGDDGVEADGTILRIPEIFVGSLRLSQVGALAIGAPRSGSHLIDWYSKKNAGPVIGWLGGNVLRRYRITLDYAHHVSYRLAQSPADAHDLDQVGVTLEFRDGAYWIAGVASKLGKPVIEGVQPGDKLLQVDGLALRSATWGQIFAALHGHPGEVRVLRLERDRRPFTLRARVSSF